jgi:O-antigen/teichoic acid export membrane protein
MRRKIVSSTLAFSIFTFIQPAISFFLLPLYLSYLTIDEYGVYAIITTFSYFITIVSGLRIYTSLHSYYYDYNDSKEKQRLFLGSVYGFTLWAGIILFGVLILVGDSLFGLIFNNSIDFYPNGLIGVISGIFLSFIEPYLLFQRNEQRLKSFGIITATLIVLTVLFQVIFIIFLDLGVTGALAGRAIAVVITGILCSIKIYSTVPFKIDKTYIRQGLIFSLPLIPYAIIAWITRYADRYFVEHFLTLEILGVYSLLSTICLLMFLANDGLTNGVQPFIFELITRKTKESHNTALQICRAFLYVLLWVCSTFILFFSTINYWYPIPKIDTIIPYIALGMGIFYFYSFYSLLRMGLLYDKKSKQLSMASFFYAVVFVVALYFLIPAYGIWGALLSNLIGFIVLIVINYQTSKHFSLSLRISYRIFLWPLAIATCMIVIGLSPHFSNLNYLQAALLQFSFVTAVVGIATSSSLKIIFCTNKRMSEND